MDKEQYQLGMIGLGVMGRNLVLNMGDQNFAVLGYDKNEEAVYQLNAAREERKVFGVSSLDEFIRLLKKPRNVMLMVPAGPPVDAVISELMDHLEPDDLIIDGGNSYYKDTELRQETLAEKGIHFLGVGISGGESGARHGPSIMPGGPTKAYQRVKPVLEAIAAQVDGEPCVTYLGPKGAGHYVKMVHNGIEYGLMQLIAETYHLLKQGLELKDSELHKIYTWWNQMEPSSYLIEITADIFSDVDEKTGKRLIEVILDEANQKGTGKWTSQDAMDLQVPVPGIDIAVAMRNLSTFKDQRVTASQILQTSPRTFQGDHEHFIDTLRMALYAAMIVTFAQGLAQLRAASMTDEYNLNLEAVARIWRGGCIIRAGLLHEIRAAYHRQPDLPNLLLDPELGADVLQLRESLSIVVRAATELNIPTPGFMAALAYFDAYRSSWLPANLIQAQRDYFGAHTYERIDTKGVFHNHWEPDFGENKS